jgi:hypothetical protein
VPIGCSARGDRSGLHSRSQERAPAEFCFSCWIFGVIDSSPVVSPDVVRVVVSEVRIIFELSD